MRKILSRFGFECAWKCLEQRCIFQSAAPSVESNKLLQEQNALLAERVKLLKEQEARLKSIADLQNAARQRVSAIPSAIADPNSQNQQQRQPVPLREHMQKRGAVRPDFSTEVEAAMKDLDVSTPQGKQAAIALMGPIWRKHEANKGRQNGVQASRDATVRYIQYSKAFKEKNGGEPFVTWYQRHDSGFAGEMRAQHQVNLGIVARDRQEQGSKARVNKVWANRFDPSVVGASTGGARAYNDGLARQFNDSITRNQNMRGGDGGYNSANRVQSRNEYPHSEYNDIPRYPNKSITERLKPHRESSKAMKPERIKIDENKLNSFLSLQKDIAKNTGNPVAFTDSEQSTLASRLPANVGYDQAKEWQLCKYVFENADTIKNTPERYKVFLRKNGDWDTFVNVTDSMTGGISKRNSALITKKIEEAKSNRASEKADAAGMKEFEIAEKNEKVGYIELHDSSDTKLVNNIDRSAFPQILAKRGLNIYSSPEDRIQTKKNDSVFIRLLGRLLTLKEANIKNFYIDINAHGKDKEGLLFGGEIITPNQLSKIFKIESFKDCKFTINTVACQGGGLATMMKDFQDIAGAEKGRITVFTQTKPDALNTVKGVFNNRQDRYDTLYNAKLSEYLMQGITPNTGPKLTYGQAHLKADEYAKKYSFNDASVHRSNPEARSSETASTQDPRQYENQV